MSIVFVYRDKSVKYNLGKDYNIVKLSNEEFFKNANITIDSPIIANVIKPTNTKFDEDLSKLQKPKKIDLTTTKKLFDIISKNEEENTNINTTNVYYVNDEDANTNDENKINEKYNENVLEVYNILKDYIESNYNTYNVNRDLAFVVKSIYGDEFYKLQSQMWNTKGTHFELDSKPYVGWFFNVENINNINVDIVIYDYDDYGCGCFSQSYPIAIFNNIDSAQNFKLKCDNVAESDLINCKINDETQHTFKCRIQSISL